MGEEKFLSLGSPLTGREVGQDGGELQSLRGECSSRSRGKAAPAQCGRAACPSLRHAPTGAGRGWALELRLQTAGQGEDWGWPAQAGWNPTATTTEGVRAEVPAALEARCD